MATALRVIMSR